VRRKNKPEQEKPKNNRTVLGRGLKSFPYDAYSHDGSSILTQSKNTRQSCKKGCPEVQGGWVVRKIKKQGEGTKGTPVSVIEAFTRGIQQKEKCEGKEGGQETMGGLSKLGKE